MRGWIGVDLDGTLAKSVAGQTREQIGAPIHPMVQLVKKWLAHGEDVRIFTARVNPNHRQCDAVRARRAIEAWCKRHLGQILPVTYEKDWDMILLFDDRSRQVERDTGRVFGGRPRDNLKAQRYAIGHDSSPAAGASYLQETLSLRRLQSLMKPKSALKFMNPGDVTLVTGVYRILHADRHLPDGEIFLHRGFCLPVCPNCKVKYALLKSISYDQHLSEKQLTPPQYSSDGRGGCE